MARLAVLYFPIGETLTCKYEFTVQKSALLHAVPENRSIPYENLGWTGQGSGGSYFGKTEGLVGPKPFFELCGGWMTLRPTDGWTQSLPACLFSDEDPLLLDDRKRELKSFSVYIGEALARVTRIGDHLRLSRDRAGDFTYKLARESDAILNAGSVDRCDEGGVTAVWQEWETRPNPNLEKQKKLFSGHSSPEFVTVAKPHVNVRIHNEQFRLGKGETAYVEPYYTFVVRLRYQGGIGTVSSEAIYACGKLAELSEELIQDAAKSLIKPLPKML